MTAQHLVVDGSNIATEGRSLPSLQQLQEAVTAFRAEHDYDTVTVVVDATFGHRIDSAERQEYDKAVDAGQIITPPAGVIGRGDAFILEIADRADAVVLSNDSFQEFHGSYEWLFEEGRLVGGKPVPGVGWIFLARAPVRGPKSRRAVSDARKKRAGKTAPASRRSASRSPGRQKARDTAEKAASSKRASSRSNAGDRAGDEPARKKAGKDPEPYNDPLPFIEFVGAHPVGSTVVGQVEQFSSHGAYILADGTRCYVSLKSMGDPAPRSAKEVLDIGEARTFVVDAIDTPRRGIDLVLPATDAPPASVTEAEPTREVERSDPAAGDRRSRRSREAVGATGSAEQVDGEPSRQASAPSRWWPARSRQRNPSRLRSSGWRPCMPSTSRR